jgi:putative chitinase
MQIKKTQLVQCGCTAAMEDKYLDAINAACAKYNIDSRLRISAFIAQIFHESARLTAISENLSYSADGLQKTWPSRFNSDLANQCARQPEKIANVVYSGRMGNVATGDGWKYRGRGFIQLTGKSTYDEFSQSVGIDCVNNPDSVAQPTNAALSAAWFWNSRGLNAYADRGDFLTTTKKINGGTNGQADRDAIYKKALIVFGDGAVDTTPTDGGPTAKKAQE